MMKFTCYYSSDHAPFGAEILILSAIQSARVCLVKRKRKWTKHTYNNNTMSRMCCTNPIFMLWFHKSEIIPHKLPRPYRNASAGLLCSSYKHSRKLREAPAFTEAWGRNTQVALRVTSPVSPLSASATAERGGALLHYMSNFSTIEAFQGASVFWLLPVVELDRVPTTGNCTREGG